ncbi:MAG: hypothetical protein IT249_13305 [Chitinophagaceae bacterium]|nr:hypothetical protein [Chitinophagaceae bacterium]
MKKIICFIFLLPVLINKAIACEVCERNQPAVLKGITHGSAAETRWDYLIVCSAIVIVLLSAFYCIKWVIRPGEKSDRHIKRVILNSEYHEG